MKDIERSFEYTFQLDRNSINEEKRVVRGASLATSNPIKHTIGFQDVDIVLSHSPDAIVTRGDTIPMLWNHDMNTPIGVIRNISHDGNTTRGDFHFSNNSKAQEVWRDFVDGFISDTSIKAVPDEFDESDTEITVNRWHLVEGSVVTLGRDPSVGLNRANDEGSHMTTEKEPGKETAREDDDVNVVDFKISRSRNLKEGEVKGVKAERKRIAEIRETFGPHLHRGAEYTDLMDECIDKGVKIERATAALLDLYGGESEPLTTDYQQDEHNGSMDRNTSTEVGKKSKVNKVSMGADVLDRYLQGAEDAIMVRSGLIEDKDVARKARDNEFYGMRMSELAREYLRVQNINTSGMDQRAMIGAAFTRGSGIIGHSTSDFSNLLENVANKAALIGFDEAEETWRTWCRTGNLPDFRQGSRVNMSTFGDLDVIYENGEYKYGTFSDLKEVLTLATYGKLFSISRQAIINDDVDAFSRIPRSMGRAANRKVGDLAYAILTGNPTMNQDSTALFHANHSNFVAGGSGAAPSVATLETAFTAMATQTDPAGNTLNVMPAYLIVPHALRGTAEVLQGAQYDPAGTAGTLTPNTVQGRFQVVADARLDSNDAAAWFLAGNQNVYDTVELAFLDGNDAPYLESKDGWSQDGVEYKVRIDAVAAALDFRALYMNDGN